MGRQAAGMFVVLVVCVSRITQVNAAAQKQASKDALNSSTEKEWGEKIGQLLLFINSKDRETFARECLLKSKSCHHDKNSLDSQLFTWDTSNVYSAVKTRFWNFYRCIIKRNEEECPVNGAWSIWGQWNDCNKKCGHSFKNRSRICNNPSPKKGGRPCDGAKAQNKTCLGICTTIYGKEITPAVEEAMEYLNIIHAGHMGLRDACFDNHCISSYVEERLEHPATSSKYWSSLMCVKFGRGCPVDGQWTPWVTWSNCSARCGQGIRYRLRHCRNPVPSGGGSDCQGNSMETSSCIKTACSLEGSSLTQWSDFSQCSVSCGSYGEQRSSRKCLKPRGCWLGGGGRVFKQTITKPCYMGPCNSPGGWSTWLQWTPCSEGCQGSQSRVRLCNKPLPSGAHTCHGDAQENKTCILQGICTDQEVTLEFTSWGEWASCSKSCNGGTQIRPRICNKELASCNNNAKDTRYCNIEPCPVPGGLSGWTAWSVCSASCGEGKRYRYRSCDRPLPQNGGTCSGAQVEAATCKQGVCPRPIFVWAEWSQWSQCDVTCGGGSSKRIRRCENKSVEKSGNCPGKNVQVKPCGMKECPVAGQWSTWMSWASCSSTCGYGLRVRDRTCTNPFPQGGGLPCPGHASEAEHCIQQPCHNMTEKGVIFNGESYIDYYPAGLPTRLLFMFLRIKPSQPDGIIFHRHSEHCSRKNVLYCDSSVVLYLHNRHAILEVKAKKDSLKIEGPQLQLNIWKSIVVTVLPNVAVLDVSTNKPQITAFKNQSTDSVKINYDQHMRLGSLDKVDQSNGFIGEIAEVHVNYRRLQLIKSVDWSGYGSPTDDFNIEFKQLGLRALYPSFNGNQYTWYPVSKGSRELLVELVFLSEAPEGLLMYNPGLHTSSFFMLAIKKEQLLACVQIYKDKRCTDELDVKTGTWYHVMVQLSASTIQLRVDNNPGSKVTLSTTTFRPSSQLYVGGCHDQDKAILERIYGIGTGFQGLVYALRLNHKMYSFKRAMVVDATTGMINEFIATEAAHYSEITSFPEEVIRLICNSSASGHSQEPEHVIWFKGTCQLKQSDNVHISPSGLGKASVVSLNPSTSSHVGVYACMTHNRREFTVTHAYGVIQDRERIGVNEVMVEESLAWLTVLFFILAVACVCVAFRLNKRKKAQTLAGLMGPIKQKVAIAVGSQVNIIELDDKKGNILEVLPLVTLNNKRNQKFIFAIEDMVFSVARAIPDPDAFKNIEDCEGTALKTTETPSHEHLLLEKERKLSVKRSHLESKHEGWSPATLHKKTKDSVRSSVNQLPESLQFG